MIQRINVKMRERERKSRLRKKDWKMMSVEWCVLIANKIYMCVCVCVLALVCVWWQSRVGRMCERMLLICRWTRGCHMWVMFGAAMSCEATSGAARRVRGVKNCWDHRFLHQHNPRWQLSRRHGNECHLFDAMLIYTLLVQLFEWKAWS